MNLKKTYLIILLIGIIAISVVAYLSLAILGKSIEPLEIVDRFHIYRSILTQGTLMFFFILMVFSNIIYLKRKKGIYFLVSGLYFVTFTLLDYVNIREQLFAFRKANGLWEGNFSLAVIAGIFISLIVSVIVVVNFILIRQHKKRQDLRQESKNPDSNSSEDGFS